MLCASLRISRHDAVSLHRTLPAVARYASSAAAQVKQDDDVKESTAEHVRQRATSSRSSGYPPPQAFASYTTTLPPTNAQLKYANRYFLNSQPSFLSGASKFRTLPVSAVPEIAFLGRSNVGKSSLLNALVQRTGLRLANISSRPGRTREMNAFGLGGAKMIGGKTREDGSRLPDKWVGRGGLVVLDMPGYGKASREEWGKEILKYLSGRASLRRAFVLIDGEHGLKRSDLGLLELLREHGIAHQVVLSKIDKLLAPRGKISPEIISKNLPKLRTLLEETRTKIVPESRHGPRALEDVITCSAEKDLPIGSGNRLGIDNLRWAVLSAAGLDCDVDGNKKVMEYVIQQEDASEQSDPYRAMT